MATALMAKAARTLSTEKRLSVDLSSGGMLILIEDNASSSASEKLNTCSSASSSDVAGCGLSPTTIAASAPGEQRTRTSTS